MVATDPTKFHHIGPILKDGVPAGDLLDEGARTLRTRAMMDPEVFELELQKLFTKTWVFVGHTSELRRPGDFMMRTIGLDSVVVTRTADDRFQVLLNACSHRGGQVCREDFGNARTFRCPYHGWLYGTDGRLIGVPGEREAFGSALGDKSERGLRQARVETFHGLIFATWNVDGPSLVEDLGDYAFYLETLLRVADWEVAGPPHRWVVKANWKFGADNFSGDGYHTAFIHQSVEEVMIAAAGGTPGDAASGGGGLWSSNWGVNVNIPGTGHSTRCLMPFSLTPEAEVRTGLSEAQLTLARNGAFPVVGSVFPNFSYVVTGLPEGEPGPALTDPYNSIRVWAPLSPDTMEIWSWALVDATASTDLKRRAAASAAQTFGPSGIFESDDAEAWSQVQRLAHGAVTRNRSMHYLSSSPHRIEDWQDGKPWPGPGEVHQGFTTEDNQWNWWRRWRDSICE